MEQNKEKTELLLRRIINAWEEKQEKESQVTKSEITLEKVDKKDRVYEALELLSKHLDTEYNLVLKNGKRYTTMDLREDMGISQISAQRHLKKLRKFNYVQLIKLEKYGFVYAINPKLYSVENVSPKIVECFNKEERKKITAQIVDLLDKLSILM